MYLTSVMVYLLRVHQYDKSKNYDKIILPILGKEKEDKLYSDLLFHLHNSFCLSKEEMAKKKLTSFQLDLLSEPGKKVRIIFACFHKNCISIICPTGSPYTRNHALLIMKTLFMIYGKKLFKLVLNSEKERDNIKNEITNIIRTALEENITGECRLNIDYFKKALLSEKFQTNISEILNCIFEDDYLTHSILNISPLQTFIQGLLKRACNFLLQLFSKYLPFRY